MADIKSRILGWDETQIVNLDDFVLIDGETAGTRRYNINRIGGGADLIEITQEEYDALPEEEKNADNKLYFITDGGSPSPGGVVSDVLVNDTSVVSNGVARISETDEKVKQIETTTQNSYKLLFSNSASDDTEIAEVRKNSKLSYNPGNGVLNVFDSGKSGIVSPGLVSANQAGYSIGAIKPDKINIDTYPGNSISIDATDVSLGGTGNTWDGTNVSLKHTISSLKAQFITTDIEYELEDTSMSGNMEIVDGCNIDPISGYTPIGLIGAYRTSHPESSAYLVNYQLFKDTLSIGFVVKNLSSSSFSGRQIKVYFTILWKKDNY